MNMVLTDKQIEEMADKAFSMEQIAMFGGGLPAFRSTYIDGLKAYRELLIDKRTLEERKEDFRVEVLGFNDKYDPQFLTKFYRYWTEANRNKKMKFELQKTWNTAGRLRTWYSNDRKFSIINNLQKSKK